MNTIRKAIKEDVSRIAEIFVFNNRMNFWPIFKDAEYSFKELQVVKMAEEFSKQETLSYIYVYDDGIVKGFINIKNNEIIKLYVDSFFQSQGIGDQLIQYAIKNENAQFLWVLEKNTRAIQFYNKHGFFKTEERILEEGTTEYLLKLKRQ